MTFATADVGDLHRQWFTVTPAPRLGDARRRRSASAPPEIVTSRVAPAATVDGVTDRTVGADGRADHLDGPEARRRLGRPVAARRAHRDVAEPRSRRPARPSAARPCGSATSTSTASTDTPEPATATALPARKPVLDPVSSTSSVAPCGTADGLTAATAGRTAEIADVGQRVRVARRRVRRAGLDLGLEAEQAAG